MLFHFYVTQFVMLSSTFSCLMYFCGFGKSVLYSILFYSILFYSILFYSILFYPPSVHGIIVPCIIYHITVYLTYFVWYIAKDCIMEETEKTEEDNEKLVECFGSLCNRLALFFNRLLFGMLSNRR